MIHRALFFLLLSTGLFSASVSFAMNPYEYDNQKKEMAQHKQALKERVEKLLADNESLAHLQQDSPLFDHYIYAFPDLVQKLIDKKAPLEVVNKSGHTPLSRAVFCNNNAATKLLLKAGANPNHEWAEKHSSDSDFPLHHALRFSSVETVHDLLAYGANPNQARKSFGVLELPFDEVFRMGSHYSDAQTKIRVMLAYGADPERTDANGLNALARLKKVYKDVVSCPIDYEKAWRYKAVGQMIIRYGVLKEIFAKKVPHDVARYLTQFAFARKETDQCPCCTKALVEVTTGCKHSFCNDCITEWLHSHKNCPGKECRVVLIKEEPPSAPQTCYRYGMPFLH